MPRRPSGAVPASGAARRGPGAADGVGLTGGGGACDWSRRGGLVIDLLVGFFVFLL